MNTSDFDYHLPPGLIAQHPAERRDASRMMVVHRADGTFEHRRFSDLPDCMRSGDLLVLNNTRVIPARIFGKKAGSGGKVELLMLEEIEPHVWDVLLRCRRRPDIGGEIILADGAAKAVLMEEGELGRARVRVESDAPVMDLLEKHGEPPLPPYIRRDALHASPIQDARRMQGISTSGESGIDDRERYQTVYARMPGAVAAPTAGLHFTPEIFERLREKGVNRAEVTLHVGLGTFRPVTAERVEEHRMEPERYQIGEESARTIVEQKRRGGRVIAVGSTAVRTLETFGKDFPNVGKLAGRSDLFVFPPFTFKMVDAMLTNFHLPKSTLLMMVSAFAGRDIIMKAYEEAIREKYRFFSYGDCMLLL